MVARHLLGHGRRGSSDGHLIRRLLRELLAGRVCGRGRRRVRLSLVCLHVLVVVVLLDERQRADAAREEVDVLRVHLRRRIAARLVDRLLQQFLCTRATRSLSSGCSCRRCSRCLLRRPTALDDDLLAARSIVPVHLEVLDQLLPVSIGYGTGAALVVLRLMGTRVFAGRLPGLEAGRADATLERLHFDVASHVLVVGRLVAVFERTEGARVDYHGIHGRLRLLQRLSDWTPSQNFARRRDRRLGGTAGTASAVVRHTRLGGGGQRAAGAAVLTPRLLLLLLLLAVVLSDNTWTDGVVRSELFQVVRRELAAHALVDLDLHFACGRIWRTGHGGAVVAAGLNSDHRRVGRGRNRRWRGGVHPQSTVQLLQFGRWCLHIVPVDRVLLADESHQLGLDQVHRRLRLVELVEQTDAAFAHDVIRTDDDEEGVSDHAANLVRQLRLAAGRAGVHESSARRPAHTVAHVALHRLAAARQTDHGALGQRVDVVGGRHVDWARNRRLLENARRTVHGGCVRGGQEAVVVQSPHRRPLWRWCGLRRVDLE